MNVLIPLQGKLSFSLPVACVTSDDPVLSVIYKDPAQSVEQVQKAMESGSQYFPLYLHRSVALCLRRCRCCVCLVCVCVCVGVGVVCALCVCVCVYVIIMCSSLTSLAMHRTV